MPWAWFPAEAQTKRRRSGRAASALRMALKAPRIL